MNFCFLYADVHLNVALVGGTFLAQFISFSALVLFVMCCHISFTFFESTSAIAIYLWRNTACFCTGVPIKNAFFKLSIHITVVVMNLRLLDANIHVLMALLCWTF